MKLRGINKTIHALFEIGVIGKAVDGLLETVGGILLLLVSPEQISWMLRAVTQHELPHELLARLPVQSTGTRTFAAVFLLWHGAVKAGLVSALLLKKWWAYPLAVVAFSLFLAYQVYRYLHTHSEWLLVLSILDLFVIVFTWLEYNRSLTSSQWSEHSACQ